MSTMLERSGDTGGKLVDNYSRLYSLAATSNIQRTDMLAGRDIVLHSTYPGTGKAEIRRLETADGTTAIPWPRRNTSRGGGALWKDGVTLAPRGTLSTRKSAWC